MRPEPANPDGVDEDFPADEATLGGRIVMARTARGLSAAQLARRLGVAEETIKNWESDRAEPRVNMLQRLAGLVDVPPMWLLGGDAVEATADFEVNVDETADLASKLDRIVALHERTSILLFEVQSEIRRLQGEIDRASLKV